MVVVILAVQWLSIVALCMAVLVLPPLYLAAAVHRHSANLAQGRKRIGRLGLFWVFFLTLLPVNVAVLLLLWTIIGHIVKAVAS